MKGDRLIYTMMLEPEISWFEIFQVSYFSTYGVVAVNKKYIYKY